MNTCTVHVGYNESRNVLSGWRSHLYIYLEETYAQFYVTYLANVLTMSLYHVYIQCTCTCIVTAFSMHQVGHTHTCPTTPSISLLRINVYHQ